MKTTLSLLLIAGMSVTATAQIPGIITYQGQVTSSGTNFTGTGEFRFLIYRTGPPLLTLWSHDNSSIAGEQPGSSIFIPVTNGLFTVGLGDTSVTGMTAAIPPDLFSNATLHLRIWFSDGANGLALLSPDQRITSAAYAMRAGNVPDEAITGAQIAPGSIRGVHIASNSITSLQIANTLTLGDLTIQTANSAKRIELYGSGDSGTLYMNHGSIGRFLEASGTPNGGFLRLFDKL